MRFLDRYKGYNNLSNISFKLLLIWILTPIFKLIFTPIIGNEVSRFVMFNILIIIGFSGLIISCIYFVKKRIFNKIEIKKYLPIFIAILLLIWCFITCFFSLDFKLSFFGSFYRKEGFETYLAYFGIFLLGIMLKNKSKMKKLFNIFIIVEIIVSIISIMNNDITYLLTKNIEPYDGVFSQFNHYGYYLMFGVLISIYMFLDTNKKYKYLYLIPYSLLLYTLLMNDTFGSILSVFISIIGIIILFRKNIKEIIMIIIIAILLCCLTFRNGQNIMFKNFVSLFSDVSVVEKVIKDRKKNNIKNNIDTINYIGTTRGVLWRYGIKYIIKRPITGYGIECLDILYGKDLIDQDRPHNILIQMAVFTGIPGLILYSLFILTILFRSLKKIKYFDEIYRFIFVMCICYLMSSMFGNSMFYTSPYFSMFLGMLSSKIFYLNSKKKKI